MDELTTPLHKSAPNLAQQLHELAPNIFAHDGSFDAEALVRELGTDAHTRKSGLQLRFIGSGFAKYLANSPAQTLIARKASKQERERERERIHPHVLIKGNNIEALKHLRSAYHNSIKLIYIDPPYNTQNKDFVYNDSFSFTPEQLAVAGLDESEIKRVKEYSTRGENCHSAWLAFMYPRLVIARQLLRSDGVIFISIDDNEAAHLKLLCDEIFGEENFVAQLSVVDKLNGNDNSSGLIETQEYCFIYAKQKEMFEMGALAIDDSDELADWQIDEVGYWKEGRGLKMTGENAPRDRQPNLFFPVYIDENNLTVSTEPDNQHTYELFPITNGMEMSWSWSKQKMQNEKDDVIVKKTKDGYSLYKKQRPALGDLPTKRAKTTFYSPKYSTANSNKIIKELFDGKSVFTYSKSVYLIQDFIQLATSPNDGDIVMDFFAGSGTTAHAVLAANAQDGGNRRFICVQLDELIDPKNKAAYEFASSLNAKSPTIYEITRERIFRAQKLLNNCEQIEEFELIPIPASDVGEFVLDEKLFASTNAPCELLTSFMLADSYSLNTPINWVDLAGFKAALVDNRLYVLEAGFGYEQLEALAGYVSELKAVVFSEYAAPSAVIKSLKDAYKNLCVELKYARV